MNQIKIGFLGYGTKALDCLMEHELFDVRYFLAPRARLCEDVYVAKEKYREKLSMEIVENNEDLSKRFAEIKDVDCFLMNACPIILNSEVLRQMRVFNIHPGDLKYNRGHQPHCWTVRLGETETKIVLHTVSEKIDAGKIIKSVEIPVKQEDSATDVLNRAEDQIPILLDGLYQYLTGKTSYESVVEEGLYRKVMVYEDYKLNFWKDSKEEIQRKILSRSMNHGAFFMDHGQRVYVDRMLSFESTMKMSENQVTIQIEKKQELVFVNSSVLGKMVFHLNKIENAE